VLAFGDCSGPEGNPHMKEPPVSSPEEMYAGLRSLALNTQLSNLDLPADLAVYGAVMELGMENAVITVACFATGDASMYYSTGGGTLGGVTVPTVHAEAIRMVKVFGDLVELLPPVDLAEVPAVGHTSFVAITATGLRSASAPTATIVSGGTPLIYLFGAGQNVITAFRESAHEQAPTIRRRTMLTALRDLLARGPGS
jgi:hypothetical protein